MTKKQMEELGKIMIQTFNDGYEQIILPQLEVMQEEIEEKIEKSKEELREELTEVFKTGQKSVSNRLEEVEVSVSQVAKEHKVFEKRLNKVEIVVKAN